ncbi:MAG: hypothetical protein AAF620_04430 [Bacteroidota bacterium]
MKVFLSKYVRASSLYVVIGLLPLTINILLLPLYLRYVSPEEYGYLALLNIYAVLFNAFSCLQLNISGSTQYFSKGIDRETFRSAILSGSAVLILFWFGLFTLMGDIFFSFYKSNVVFFPLGISVLLTAALGQLHACLFVFLKNEYRLKELAVYSIGILSISIISQLFLISYIDLSVAGIVYGGLAAKALVTPLILFNYRKWFFGHGRAGFFNKKVRSYLRKGLGFSLPFLPTVLLFQAQKVGDRMILERFLPLEIIGQYTVLITLLGLPSLIINAVFNAIRPRILELLEDKRDNLINQVEFFYVLGIIFIYLCTILVGSNLQWFTDNPKYIEIKQYLNLGVIVSLPASLLYFNHLRLMQRVQNKLIAFFALYSFVLQLALLLFLVPLFGITAAFYAMGAAGSLTYFLNLYAANRNRSWEYLARQTPLLVFLILALFGMMSTSVGVTPTMSSISICLAGTLYILLILRKRRITLKELYHLF